MATVVATVVTAASAALPWARTGRTRRSGFDLARLADSLGIAEGIPARMLVIGIALLPFLAAAAWLAAVVGRQALLAAAAGVAGVVALGAAVVLWQSPLPADKGGVVGGIAGFFALGGSCSLLLNRERR